MGYLRRWMSESIPPILVFLAIDIVITGIFFVLSSSAIHIGTLRPVNTIPLKVVELLAIGVGIGIVATLFYRHIDLSLITMSIAYTALLDLDHLPSAFGLAQPIRPAHSIAFLCVVLLALTISFRKRKEVPLIFAACFFGHLAGDTGFFAMFAPFTFELMSLDSVRVPLVVLAVLFAVLAGYVKSRRQIVVTQKLMIRV